MTPDFEVRRLDQYPTEELESLFAATHSFASQSRLPVSERKIMDTWAYRIQEALKLKRKNDE